MAVNILLNTKTNISFDGQNFFIYAIGLNYFQYPQATNGNDILYYTYSACRDQWSENILVSVSSTMGYTLQSGIVRVPTVPVVMYEHMQSVS